MYKIFMYKHFDVQDFHVQGFSCTRIFMYMDYTSRCHEGYNNFGYSFFFLSLTI